MGNETSYMIEKDERLDKPGAGIPWHHKQFTKYIVVPLLPMVLNWERGLAFFQKQVSEILALVEDLDEQTLAKQVLIPPMIFLEDSSRFYSINMVLEHLVMVNFGTLEIMNFLAEEKEVERVLGTEKVKPVKNINHIKNLVVFEKAYTRMIKKSPKKRSLTTKEHPWFGHFNNTHWHAFIGMHNKVHKKQIQKILELM